MALQYMPDGTPVAFHDLSEGSYPITIEYIAVATGKVLQVQEIPSGPALLKMPTLSGLFGPIRVRMSFGDGIVIEQEPE
jgi:hypothetical protein